MGKVKKLYDPCSLCKRKWYCRGKRKLRALNNRLTYVYAVCPKFKGKE